MPKTRSVLHYSEKSSCGFHFEHIRPHSSRRCGPRVHPGQNENRHAMSFHLPSVGEDTWFASKDFPTMHRRFGKTMCFTIVILHFERSACTLMRFVCWPVTLATLGEPPVRSLASHALHLRLSRNACCCWLAGHNVRSSFSLHC